MAAANSATARRASTRSLGVDSFAAVFTSVGLWIVAAFFLKAMPKGPLACGEL